MSRWGHHVHIHKSVMQEITQEIMQEIYKCYNKMKSLNCCSLWGFRGFKGGPETEPAPDCLMTLWWPNVILQPKFILCHPIPSQATLTLNLFPPVLVVAFFHFCLPLPSSLVIFCDHIFSLQLLHHIATSVLISIPQWEMFWCQNVWALLSFPWTEWETVALKPLIDCVRIHNQLAHC